MSEEKRKVIPRSEQETIVSYDVERKQWHILPIILSMFGNMRFYWENSIKTMSYR